MNSWVLSGIILASGAIASVLLWLLLNLVRHLVLLAVEKADDEMAAEERDLQ